MLDSEHVGVLFLVLLILAVVGATAIFVARREKRAPADDIGVMWLVVFSFYAALPPLAWLLQGGMYSVINLYRLYLAQPSVDEVVHLLKIAFACVGGFAGVYLVLRRHLPRGIATKQPYISTPKMTGAVTVVLVFQTIMFLLAMGGFIRTPESYYDSYIVIRELPLVARQALKIGGAISSMALLVFLVAALQRWPHQRRFLIFYLVIVLSSFDPEGSRLVVATGLLSLGIAWHILVRQLSIRWWLTVGTIGLVVFLALGIVRTVESIDEFDPTASGGIGAGEFDALWANSVELLQEREYGRLEVPFSVRFGEFWAFVPSQLLPFQKLSADYWFLETFYPDFHEAGGGWAFGIISQAVIGDGVIEAFIRGAILGALAVWAMKWYRSPTSTWWRLPLYLYWLVFSFQSIRDTAFRQIGDTMQSAIPAILLIALLGELLDIRGRVSHHSNTACQKFST